MIDRLAAVAKLFELIENPSLIRHCYSVELVMRGAAARFGHPDEADAWGIAGLLHDADYEKFPDRHPNVIVDWLRSTGEERIAYAISAHFTEWNVPYVSTLDKALLACDELTGFVVACALIRPTGIIGMDTASVIKKFKNPKFAAGVSRFEVTAGAEMLGVELDELVGFIISVLNENAERLGLSGNRFDVGVVR
ncbi:MAG: HD domain-containing protein [Acidobacteria bacterium]|nr:HD domain-containing protein [Acidobacteriota bacterium]